jgi:predicted DNA-binding protein
VIHQNSVLQNAAIGITFPSMTTTVTMKIPKEMAQKLEAVAVRKRVPKSKLVREALDVFLNKQKTKLSLYDRMKDGIGCVSSGKGDLSTNPKHMEGYGR